MKIHSAKRLLTTAAVAVTTLSPLGAGIASANVFDNNDWMNGYTNTSLTYLNYNRYGYNNNCGCNRCSSCYRPCYNTCSSCGY